MRKSDCVLTYVFFIDGGYKMFKENDYLVYRKDVCRVKEIRKNNENGIDYYILAPIDDDSLIIEVPTDNRARLIRNVISKEEAEKLISIIPKIEVLSNIDDKYIESTYKDLISNGAHEDLVKIIKTSYLRNEERKIIRKKQVKEIVSILSRQKDIYIMSCQYLLVRIIKKQKNM